MCLMPHLIRNLLIGVYGQFGAAQQRVHGAACIHFARRIASGQKQPKRERLLAQQRIGKGRITGKVLGQR